MGPFYWVRHAESDWNAANRLCGRTDVALSEMGRLQARRLAERFAALPVEALYTSPLRRAVETAEIIAERHGIQPVVEPSLVELNYGAWEGMTFAEIMHRDGENFRAWDADPGAVAPPGGESGEEALARITPFLDMLRTRHPQGNVVVVSHKTISRLIVCHVLGLSLSEYRRRLTMDNAAVSIIQPEEPGWRLVLLNDISHLAVPGTSPPTADGAF